MYGAYANIYRRDKNTSESACPYTCSLKWSANTEIIIIRPQLEQKNNEQARNCALMIRGSNRTQHQRGSMA